MLTRVWAETGDSAGTVELCRCGKTTEEKMGWLVKLALHPAWGWLGCVPPGHRPLDIILGRL